MLLAPRVSLWLQQTLLKSSWIEQGTSTRECFIFWIMLLLRPNPTYSDALISIATHATRNGFSSPAMWMNRPHRGNRKAGKRNGCFFFFFSPMCWFEWPDSDHAKTETRGRELQLWASAPTDAAVSREDISQPTACHFRVAEDEVRVDMLPPATNRCCFLCD